MNIKSIPTSKIRFKSHFLGLDSQNFDTAIIFLAILVQYFMPITTLIIISTDIQILGHFSFGIFRKNL